MSYYKRNRIRLISAAVAACFLLQEVALAAPAVPGVSPMSAMPPPLAISQFIANPAQIQVPLEHVMVQEIHPGTNGKLIIHIQDAHANLSGQQSLAKALDQLLSKYDLKLVLVEGSARDSSLDEIRKLAPLKEWKIIARRFLYEGIISGEEYLNLTTEHPMKIIGVEYRDLYDEAVKAYAALVDRRKDILHYLYQSKISLERLKTRMYPKELKDYEAGRAYDDTGSIDFKTGFSSLLRLAKLADYPLTDLPQVRKLELLMEKEASIAFDKANAEQAQVLEALGERGAGDEAKAFMEASRRMRFSQVSQYMLLSKLLQTAEQKQMALESFPELKAYAEYLSKFTELNVDDLMTQLEYLEDKIYEKLLPDDNARKVRAIDRFLGLLGNAYKLQMSSRDFKMFTFNEKDFKTESWLAFMNRQLVDLGFFESLIPYKPYLEEARADFGRFYQLVGDRDEAFVTNAKRIMTEQHEDAAVLIAGGYHTAHLTELLRAEGTSYIVLTPVVTDTTDHDRYEELLLSHLKDQEKQLAATHTNKKDTTPYRAQNVATTKIPRGVRIAPALARFAIGAIPLGAARLAQEHGLPMVRLQGAAARLTTENPEQTTSVAARMVEAENPMAVKIFASWQKLAAGDRPTLREDVNGMPGIPIAHTKIFDANSPMYKAFASATKGEVARQVIIDWIKAQPFLKKYGSKTGLIGALENAFQHGLANDSRLMVGMVKSTTDIWIVVADTGSGMDIQRAFAGERDITRGSEGLGLETSIFSALRRGNKVWMASRGIMYYWGIYQWSRAEGNSRPAPDKITTLSPTKGVLWMVQRPLPAAARMADPAQWKLLLARVELPDAPGLFENASILPRRARMALAGSVLPIQTAKGELGLLELLQLPQAWKKAASPRGVDALLRAIRSAVNPLILQWQGGPGIVRIPLVRAKGEGEYKFRDRVNKLMGELQPLADRGILYPEFVVINKKGRMVDVLSLDPEDNSIAASLRPIIASFKMPQFDLAAIKAKGAVPITLATKAAYKPWKKTGESGVVPVRGSEPYHPAHVLLAAALSKKGGAKLAVPLWNALLGIDSDPDQSKAQIDEAITTRFRDGNVGVKFAKTFALRALASIAEALAGARLSLRQALESA